MTERHDTWMVSAICRQVGPINADTWYPENKKGGHCRTTIRRAKDMCNVCPVKQRCLDYALAYDEQWGIWGGVNMALTRRRDRNAMRAERQVVLLPRIERMDALLGCINDGRRTRHNDNVDEVAS